MAKRSGAFALVGLAFVVLAAACSSSGKVGSAGAGGDAATSVVGHGHAKQKVAADLAFVIVTPEGSGFLDGSFDGSTPSTDEPQISLGKRAKIQQDLAQLGIVKTDVHFDSDPLGYGDVPTDSVRVEVPVARLPELARKVNTAVGSVLGGKPSHGLRLLVSDCSAALTRARPAALADARRQARKLALAAHVTLGALRSVREGSGPTTQDAYLSLLGAIDQPCGRESAERSSLLGDAYGNDGLVRLDAKPEVELNLELSASYALGSPSERVLSAPGRGDSSGPADAADIVISTGILGEIIDPGPETPVVNRAKVIAAVTALGVPEDDVDIDTHTGGHLSYVRVHLAISRFRSVGKKIVAAVKHEVGSSPNAGVFFTTSKCQDLIQQARVKALGDAGRRIQRLARTAKVQAGRIVGLDEPDIASAVGTPVDLCHPDFSQFDQENGLGDVLSLSVGGGGGVPFESLDAESRVTEQVNVTETRAISD